MKTDKPRLTYIDVAKGLAMLMVVMQHCGASLSQGTAVLCMLDVPLFFVCSGFLAYKVHYDYRKDIPRKVMRILVPFILAVGAAALFYHLDFAYILYDVTKCGYWFLEVLFMMYAILWIINRGSMRLLIIASAILEIIFLASAKLLPDIINNIFVIPSMARYWPCFVAGVLLRKYDVKHIGRYVGTVMLAATVVGMTIHGIPGEIGFILNIIGYASGAILLFYFVKCIEPTLSVIVRRSLTHIGRYSLTVYIIHFYFVPRLAPLGDSFVINFTYTVIISLLVIAVSLLTGRILTFATPLNKVLDD